MRDKLPDAMVEALIRTAERANVGSRELFERLRNKQTDEDLKTLAWMIEDSGARFHAPDSAY